MKNILPFVFLFLISCSNSANSNSDKFYMGLNGSVKSIMDKKYEVTVKFNDIVKEDEMYEARGYVFDKNGYIERETTYSDDGDPSLIRDFQYNDDIMIEHNSYQIYGEKKHEEYVQKLVNSDNNNLVYISYYKENPDKKDSIIIKKGNKTRNITRIAENKISNYIINFDNDGRVIEDKGIHQEGNELLYNNFYKYKDGLLIEQIEKLPKNPDKGQIVHTFEYKNFDNQGNWTESIEYEDGKAAFITIREIKYQ